MPKKEIALTVEEKNSLKEVLQLAQKQLETMGKVMPEGKAAMDKYPATNPIGFYSEIDMGIEERMKKCDLAIRAKNPLSLVEYQHLKERTLKHPAYQDMKKEMMEISKRTRVIDRALRLCKEEPVRKALEEEKKNLLENPVLQEYDLLLKGLEAYSGARIFAANDETSKEKSEKLSKERTGVENFYYNKFHILMGENLGYSPYGKVMGVVNPKALEIEFDDLDDIMQCQRMTHDSNLGKSWEKVEKQSLEKASFEEYGRGIPAYMQASCDRVLDSALPDVMDRADFILIDGVSVRDKIKETEGIENPTEKQIKTFSSLYVAAALRKGHYVETFLRNRSETATDDKKINYKPVPITTKGSDSFLLKQDGENEMESITLGFFDKFLAKLGFSFYQNKVKQANAVEQIKQSRERFRKEHEKDMKEPLTKREIETKKRAFSAIANQKKNFFDLREKNLGFSYIQGTLDKQFFPEGKEHLINKATGIQVENDREKARTLCIAKMLQKGFTLKEVLDVSKNADKRAEIAKQVKEEVEKADTKSFLQMNMEAVETLMNSLEEYAKEQNISFKNPDSFKGEASFLMDLSTGAGNLLDHFWSSENTALVEKYYDKEYIQNMKERTEGFSINGMIAKERGKLGALYERLSQGSMPNSDDLVYAIKDEVNMAVFKTLEEKNGKVFEHPVNLNEMVAIQEMVTAHPKVAKYFKEVTYEDMIKDITSGQVLKKLNIEFTLLPEKMIPGKTIESKQFDVEIEPDIATPVNIVPVVDGNSDFYRMTTMDKLMEEEMDMGME